MLTYLPTTCDRGFSSELRIPCVDGFIKLQYGSYVDGLQLSNTFMVSLLARPLRGGSWG